MKISILGMLSCTILAGSALVGGETYALLSASAVNGPNQPSASPSFTSETINIQSAPSTTASSGMRSMMMMAQTQQIQFPMFYDHATYPTGPNPYDYKTSYTPSGEIKGGWAPGDQVTRSWNIKNAGSASKLTELSATLNSLVDRNNNPVPTGSQAYQDFLNHMSVSVYSAQSSTTPVFTGRFQQLVTGDQPLGTVICLSKNTTSTVNFSASMDKSGGNDLQGLKGVLDFTLQAEQTANNCFDPPFSNEDYSMKLGSTTPIKFEDYDSSGNLVTTVPSNVSLVITGPKVGGGTLSLTYSLANGLLSVNGGHYQAQVYGDPNLYAQETDTKPLYTASVYYNGQLCCQKSFSTYPGNRSNA